MVPVVLGNRVAARAGQAAGKAINRMPQEVRSQPAYDEAIAAEAQLELSKSRTTGSELTLTCSMYFGDRLSRFLAAVKASRAYESGHDCGLHCFHFARCVSLQYKLVRQSIEQVERRRLSIAEARKVYGIGVGIHKCRPKAIAPVAGTYAAGSQETRRLEAKNLQRHRSIHAAAYSRAAHVQPPRIETPMLE
jgi:hypothetical protein